MSIKHNWGSQLVGRSVSGSHSKNTRFSLYKNRRYTIDLNSYDKQQLMSTMEHELIFVNAVISSFDSMHRMKPEILLQLTKSHVKLFGILAATQTNLRKYANKNIDTVLPKYLKPFSKLILGKTEQNLPKINEYILILFESATAAGSILPRVRHNIAVSVLTFYQKQAKIRMQTLTLSQQKNQVYRTTPNNLTNFSILQKRHVQIPKIEIEIIWDEKKEVSLIKTPYTSKYIYVNNINLKENRDWNTIVIHQLPKEIPTIHTPWCIELMKSDDLYILNYVDVNNPEHLSGFREGKKRKYY